MATNNLVKLPGQGEVFDFGAVKTVDDVPQHLLKEIRQAFPHVGLGEIPDQHGNVMVGKPTPKTAWHPLASLILKQAHGKPIPAQ